MLDAEGNGLTSNILAAIDEVQHVNGNGRQLLIHGVNLSVGYDFDPEWFACGQSPLCVEVDRWPSKQFADARLAPANAVIHAQLGRVEAFTGEDPSVARAQVPRLHDSPAARHTFVAQVFATLPPTATHEEAQPAHLVQVSGDPHFLDRLGLERLGTPLAPPPPPS